MIIRKQREALKAKRGTRKIKSNQFRRERFAFLKHRDKAIANRPSLILRINAACAQHGIRYSQLIAGLREARIILSLEELSDIASHDPSEFSRLIDRVRSIRGIAKQTRTDSLSALRSIRRSMLNSGFDARSLQELFATVAFEDSITDGKTIWNDQLNRRRFELVDREIQGTLSDLEELELMALTQQMRKSVDTEYNLPTLGAQKLHRMLVKMELPESSS